MPFMDHPLHRAALGVPLLLLALTACTPTAPTEPAPTTPTTTTTTVAPALPSAPLAKDSYPVVSDGEVHVTAGPAGTLATYSTDSRTVWVLYEPGGRRVASGKGAARVLPLDSGFLRFTCSKAGRAGAKVIGADGKATPLDVVTSPTPAEIGDDVLGQCDDASWLYRPGTNTVVLAAEQLENVRSARDGSWWRMNNKAALRSVDAGRTWRAYPVPKGAEAGRYHFLVMGGLFFSPQTARGRWGTAIIRAVDGSGAWTTVTLPSRKGESLLTLSDFTDDRLLLALSDGDRFTDGSRWWVTDAHLGSQTPFKTSLAPGRVGHWFSGGRLFAVTRGANWPLGVSDDEGKTWRVFPR